MIKRGLQFIYARYRAFAPLSCFMSPRSDILRGYARWRWLAAQRRGGREIEPSIRVQGNLRNLDTRLDLAFRCHVDQGCIFWLGTEEGQLFLGERSYVGPNSFLGSHRHPLRVGPSCMIGAGCYLITANHATGNHDTPYAEQGYEGAPVSLGENVWLGCHVVVLPGVTIGDNAVIGAGAVVTKDVPTGETWAGVPARKIR